MLPIRVQRDPAAIPSIRPRRHSASIGALGGRAVAPLNRLLDQEASSLVNEVFARCLGIASSRTRLDVYSSAYLDDDFRELIRKVNLEPPGSREAIQEVWGTEHDNMMKADHGLDHLLERIRVIGIEPYYQIASQQVGILRSQYSSLKVAEENIHLAYFISNMNSFQFELAKVPDQASCLIILNQLSIMVQNFHLDTESNYLGISFDQYSILEASREAVLHTINRLKELGRLPPETPLIPPLISLSSNRASLRSQYPEDCEKADFEIAKMCFYRLHSNFEEIWKRLGSEGGFSESDRVKVLENIRDEVGLTADEFGCVYNFVWELSGSREGDLDYRRNHACDDYRLLKEALLLAAEKYFSKMELADEVPDEPAPSMMPQEGS